MPTHMPLARAAESLQDQYFAIDVTQPVVCQTMNITFDPRKGTPPYSLMIAIEDWWPLVVDLPSTYDDPTKALWLYQFPVPTFVGATTNPNLIVSVADSTGAMSNSSSILRVQNNTSSITCPTYAGAGDFIFYTEKAASQCQGYDIFWKGNYTLPLELVFLPEAAPPIYVPVASDRAVAGNMTWTVAMTGGTRFLLTMGDANANTGGVSKLNIVALNEYVSDDCITQNTYAHNVLPVQTTAPPASVFPDATSTIASLSTSKGVVATVTTIETIRSGRPVQQNQSGLSSKGFLALMIAVFLGIGLGGVVLGWCCFRRRQRRKENIKSWDLPSSDPLVPFHADPNMPIAPGVFGVKRQDSSTGSERDGSLRPSFSAANSFSDSPSRQQTPRRTSLRGWTSSAFDQISQATGGNARHQAADEYPLVRTASNPFDNNHAVATDRSGYSSRRSRTSNGTWLTADSYTDVSGTGSYQSDSQHSRSNSSPSRPPRTDSAKTSRVGPGATFRPDAASQAAYQDLLTNTASPPGSIPSLTPFAYGGGREQSPSRTRQGPQHNPRVVRHSDAGLLLDDNDEDDFDSGQVMELPPEYDSLQRAQHDRSRIAHPLGGGGGGSGDITDAHSHPSPVLALNHPTEPEEDESEFWNTVGNAH